jgi:uncharacterized membrane protein
MRNLKSLARYGLATAMTAVGILHFLKPQGFVAIVPAALPFPLALVYISGFFEVAGGVGLLVSRFRKAAAWGLILLYIAVFPANINMAIYQIPLDGQAVPAWALWARLPFQAVFIAWAWWMTREDAAHIEQQKAAA